MSDQVITLSELFNLRNNSPSAPTAPWHEQLGQRLDEELKGIKWPTALPDISEKLAELLDLPLPTLFFEIWKKNTELQTALKETAGQPDALPRTITFGEHTIESSFEPSIQIRLWKVVPLPKELKFPVCVEANFKTLKLQVKNGALTRIDSSECEITGSVSLGKTRIAEKNFGTLSLAGTLNDTRETQEKKS